MNTKQLLIEATYPIGHMVDEIYKNEVVPLLRKYQSAKNLGGAVIDITDYFAPFIKEFKINSRYYVTLTFKLSERQGSAWAMYKRHDTPEFRIALNIGEKELKTMSPKNIELTLKDFISHEVTHLLDYFRTKGRAVKNDPKDLSTGKGMYNYMTSSDEFNAFIHQLKYEIKAKKNEWHKISDMDEFNDFLHYAIPVEQIIKENPNGYKQLRKKIFKRLARENLLPRKLISSQ